MLALVITLIMIIVLLITILLVNYSLHKEYEEALKQSITLKDNRIEVLEKSYNEINELYHELDRLFYSKTKLCTEQQNTNAILNKELTKLRVICIEQQKLNNILLKNIEDFAEQIKTQKQAIVLYEKELKDYRTTKNCTSKLNLKQ